mmetsp:Transcript_48711/g.76057  ORF Transcript_48711/g.76057 Transcript_48711/m.76057 type:complete len:103 (-) Transcript_48711:223-531(-)
MTGQGGGNPGTGPSYMHLSSKLWLLALKNLSNPPCKLLTQPLASFGNVYRETILTFLLPVLGVEVHYRTPFLQAHRIVLDFDIDSHFMAVHHRTMRRISYED